MNVIEILSMIKDICMTITGIITVLTLFLKPVRKWITSLFKHTSKNEAIQALLRNEITKIYYMYLPEKAMPSHAKENLTLLYEKYKREGGNSFINVLYEDMITWSIQQSCGEKDEKLDEIIFDFKMERD